MTFSSQQVFVTFTSTSILAVSAIIVLLSTVFVSAVIIITKQSAFADGLTQEQLSASLGNRKADLLIKMNPPVVTTDLVPRSKTYC